MAGEQMPAAVAEWLRQHREPTPKMQGAGWRQLKRAHLPRLGPGPGLCEAFGAMIDMMIEEHSSNG